MFHCTPIEILCFKVFCVCVSVCVYMCVAAVMSSTTRDGATCRGPWEINNTMGSAEGCVVNCTCWVWKFHFIGQKNNTCVSLLVYAWHTNTLLLNGLVVIITYLFVWFFFLEALSNVSFRYDWTNVLNKWLKQTYTHFEHAEKDKFASD